MIRAYDKVYLEDAMRNLGEAFDYVSSHLKITLDEFLDLFIASGIAEQFGRGVPKFVSGLSGIELAMEVLTKAGKDLTFPESDVKYSFSSEYWCGWILAYYQWHSGRTFKNISKYLSMEDVEKLYPTLHEAAEEKFVDTVNSIIRRQNPPTQLQALRKSIGYSQKMLSEKSGVSLRMIQQYEQRAKNINNATGANLVALANTLGCGVEELLEQSEG